MVTVGFVVEGYSEAFLVDSTRFRNWLSKECGLQVTGPAVNARGNGQLCVRGIGELVHQLKIQAKPDKVVVLADLDPEECAPCIEERKKIIGSENIDLVVIARKALESWFLADTAAMRKWTGDRTFNEPRPEDTQEMPWNRLKKIGISKGRGPGQSKRRFVKTFLRVHGFDVRRAALHPHCPSAKYFVERICALGETADAN